MELLYRWQHQQCCDDVDVNKNKIVLIGKIMAHLHQIHVPLLYSRCVSCRNIPIASGVRGAGGWGCYIGDSSRVAVSRRCGFEKSDGLNTTVMARSYWLFFCWLGSSKLIRGMAGDGECSVTMLQTVGERKGLPIYSGIGIQPQTGLNDLRLDDHRSKNYVA